MLCENSCVQFARRKFFSFGQSENQKFWRRLFEEANRENCSTLSWLAHVFTRPGPFADIRPGVWNRDPLDFPECMLCDSDEAGTALKTTQDVENGGNPMPNEASP